MITKEDVVELAGGIRLHIESKQFEGDDTCEVRLTFDGDLIPIHMELMQFAPPRDPDTSHDVLMLVSAFGRSRAARAVIKRSNPNLCTFCGARRNALIHSAIASSVGWIDDHEFNYSPGDNLAD
jgi:hypothetical protein